MVARRTNDERDFFLSACADRDLRVTVAALRGRRVFVRWCLTSTGEDRNDKLHSHTPEDSDHFINVDKSFLFVS